MPPPMRSGALHRSFGEEDEECRQQPMEMWVFLFRRESTEAERIEQSPARSSRVTLPPINKAAEWDGRNKDTKMNRVEKYTTAAPAPTVGVPRR